MAWHVALLSLPLAADTGASGGAAAAATVRRVVGSTNLFSTRRITTGVISRTNSAYGPAQALSGQAYAERGRGCRAAMHSTRIARIYYSTVHKGMQQQPPPLTRSCTDRYES